MAVLQLEKFIIKEKKNERHVLLTLSAELLPLGSGMIGNFCA